MHDDQHGTATVVLVAVLSALRMAGRSTPRMIRKGQIILALSNPVPEIFPEDALAAGAAFASDGTSINNALAYPGLFKAALEVTAREITPTMKIAAAEVVSSLASEVENEPTRSPKTILVHPENAFIVTVLELDWPQHWKKFSDFQSFFPFFTPNQLVVVTQALINSSLDRLRLGSEDL